MTIIEFREGLARVSDKISLKSIHIVNYLILASSYVYRNEIAITFIHQIRSYH